GRDFAGGGKNVWNTGVGLQLGGQSGDQFQYYIQGYINQAILPTYFQQFVDTMGVIPGQGFGDKYRVKQSWSNITAMVSYTPVKYLNIALAYDKNFIGD